MIISVASGKGGTGKTTVAVSLALALSASRPVQFLDCDVEEPNAHIFLKPEIKDKKSAFIPVPEIDEARCDYCGKCGEVCAYHALAIIPSGSAAGKGSALFFPHLCHGCGACALLCPKRAIREVDKEIGVVETGSAGGIEFVQGRLNIGEIMSPALIRRVKENIDPARTVMIDAPPGTSCPVIAAIKNSDFCLLVTEPTPFGQNDLVLAVETVRQMKIPFGVVINRCDIGDGQVEDYCRRENIPILLKIPFDKEIALLYSRGVPLVEGKPEYREVFANILERAVATLTKR